MYKKICPYCKKEFTIPYKSLLYIKTCGKTCGYKQREIDSPVTEKQKEGLQLGRGWNKGMKGMKLWMDISGLKKGHVKGEFKNYNVRGKKNNNWKGELAGYQGRHKWLYVRRGKAKSCENEVRGILPFKCKGDAKLFVWANISGQYKRDVKDYINLCQSCHMRYDYSKEKNRLTKVLQKVNTG